MLCYVLCKSNMPRYANREQAGTKARARGGRERREPTLEQESQLAENRKQAGTKEGSAQTLCYAMLGVVQV